MRRIRAMRSGGPDAQGTTEDIASEAMARFLQRVHARPVPALDRGESWGLLMAIARSLIVDQSRRRHVRAMALVRLRRELCAERLATPDSVAETHELAGRAFMAMTHEERALAVRRMSGESWAAISRELGVSEETLRQRWSSLRRRLRTLDREA